MTMHVDASLYHPLEAYAKSNAGNKGTYIIIVHYIRN